MGLKGLKHMIWVHSLELRAQKKKKKAPKFILLTATSTSLSGRGHSDSGFQRSTSKRDFWNRARGLELLH